MVLFDTCALVKLYAREAKSVAVQDFVRDQSLIYVSALVRTEISSVLAKKRLEKKITPREESEKLRAFLNDINSGSYTEMPISEEILGDAGLLISRFISDRLCTLDAIHIATAKATDARTIATADEDLGLVAKKIGFKVAWFGPPEIDPNRKG